MSVAELLVAAWLASRLIEALEQAFVNWCTMRVRLSAQKEKDDEQPCGFQ